MKGLAKAVALLAVATGQAAAEPAFYVKATDYQGIPVKAAAVVSDEAILKARQVLERMLGRTPDIVWNLRAEGAELHLIGKDQNSSDLPEYRQYKGTRWEGDMDFDERTRGLGGRTAACSEENLLSLPSDRFEDHREICIHELAHTIMDYGVSEGVRRKIVRQYRRSLGRGLWRTTYAAKTPEEFFAELAMWFHGTQGDVGELGGVLGSGSQWLKHYDPRAYELLDDIFSARETVERLVELPALPQDQAAGLRSRRWQKGTRISILNATSRELQAVWLDYRGRRKPYATIPPGERFRQETYDTHPWLVVDDTGKVLAVFIAQPRPGFAVVKEPEQR